MSSTPAAAARPQTTIGAKMSACGATSGFDYMRIALALSVLAWHAIPITQGREAADALLASPLGSLVRVILPMFFALSGFLVTASLFRAPSIRVFLIFRALRIGPALAVEVFLSALLLGPLFTSLALGEYFSAREFFAYFTNAVGIVNYELPGVFSDHPVTAVNGGLWTVPYELECYIALTILYLLSFMRRRFFLLGATLAGGVVVGATAFLPELSSLGAHGANPFNYQNALDAEVQPRRILVLSFLAGAVLFLFRERLVLSPVRAAAAFGLGLVLLGSPLFYGLAPLPVAYATVSLGLLNPPRHKVILSGDYSYGVYLYAFPIQQMVFAFAPGQSALMNFIASTLGAVAFAVASWHLVERPALALRTRFAAAPRRAASA